MSVSKGLPYFYNSTTGKASWEAPPGMSQAEINELPGAKEHLRNEAPVTNQVDQAPAANQVRASHLLIKHSGSRRPSSWKEVGA